MVIRQFKLLIPFILFTFLFESCILDKSNEEVVLSGKVVDSSSGNAIPDVAISIELVSEIITTKSSSDGSFRAIISHGGVAILKLSKEGYEEQLAKAVFKDGAFKTIEIRMYKL